MHLTKLRLCCFRNIEELEFAPPEGTTLFVGDNGQGKTNLLEAMYFLSFGKSFRTAAPRECIRHGARQCRIEGTVRRGALERDLEVRLTPDDKKMFLFGKQTGIDGFVGNLHLLAFTCDHLDIVRGSPGERRAFLDRAMATIYPGHVGSLARYGRALKQRNRVLSAVRDGKASLDPRLLDSWDETLVEEGARILVNRVRYVDQMKKALPRGLFGSEELKMHYLSAVPGQDGGETTAADRFRRRLAEARESDRRTGYTSVGPHRDDLRLYVNGKSLADYGSAGQQRSSLLAMYFSQMEIHCGVHGFYPVFLVDDAEAELDQNRLDTFLHYLSGRTQTFLTSARDFALPSAGGGIRRMRVHNGTLAESASRP